jgi:hypothetical protein
MPRPLDLVELVIRHPGFRVRCCDGKRAIGATPAAAKGFCAVVGIADRGQVQAGIASADIAAHGQRPAPRVDVVVGAAAPARATTREEVG